MKWQEVEKLSKKGRFLVMKSGCKLFLVFLGGLSLTLFGCDKISLAGATRIDNQKEILSPTGNYSIITYCKHTGAGDPFYTYAELHYRDLKDPVETLLVLKGYGDIEVDWIDNQKLTLTIPELSVVRQVTVVSGKTITYPSKVDKSESD